MYPSKVDWPRAFVRAFSAVIVDPTLSSVDRIDLPPGYLRRLKPEIDKTIESLDGAISDTWGKFSELC